jgi:phage shock protein PspC (stress-responsive transcriptional regulator)
MSVNAGITCGGVKATRIYWRPPLGPVRRAKAYREPHCNKTLTFTHQLRHGFSCLSSCSRICNFVPMRRLTDIKDFIEWQAFGVCSSIGDRLGVATSRIRLWFIYISFLTMGSPVIIYMILAFIKNIKHYVLLRRRNPLRWL